MTLSYKYSSGEEGGGHVFERYLGARMDIFANQWNATDKVDDRVRGWIEAWTWVSGSAIHSEEEHKWMRRTDGEIISFVLPVLSVRAHQMYKWRWWPKVYYIIWSTEM